MTCKIILIQLQLVLKLIVGMTKGTKMGALFDKAIKHYIYESHKNGNYDQTSIIRLCAGRSHVLLILMTLLYIASVLLFAIYPMYMYMYEGVLVTILNIEIPGISPMQNPGYLYTMIFQYILIIWGSLGSLSADAIFMMFALHSNALTDLLKVQLKGLGEFLKEKDTYEKPKHQDSRFVRSELNKIFKDHQVIIR